MGFYFNDDLEQVKKICAEQALALMTGEIKSRVDRVKLYFSFKFLIFKYKLKVFYFYRNNI